MKYMYHTQEHREGAPLTFPVKCDTNQSWLGEAWYFWYYESDAHFWGLNFKRKTGRYHIYRAVIDKNNILDTVFNEEEYTFWLHNIELAAKKFVKKTGVKPDLKQINEYFLERGIWNRFDGILFQDITSNPNNYLVKEFQYKKRIQLAVYNPQIITNFASHLISERI